MRWEEVKASIKSQVIYRHRREYPLCRMCRFFAVSKSGYYDFIRRLGKPGRDAKLADIIAAQRERSQRTYGSAGCGYSWNGKQYTAILKPCCG